MSLITIPGVKLIFPSKVEMAKFDFVVSYSELRTFRACEQQYHLKYEEQISSKRKDARLAFGEIMHGILEAYDRGQNWYAVYEEYKKKYDRLFEEETKFDIRDAPKIMKGYLRRWAGQPLEFILLEQSVGPIELTIPGDGGPRIGLIIKPDGVARDYEGDLVLVERKTAKKFGDYGLRLYDLQSALYAFGLRKMRLPITGILWDELRTKAPRKPPVLKSGKLSKAKKIDTDYKTFLRSVLRNDEDPEDYKEILERLKRDKNRFFRRQKFPIKKPLVRNIVDDARRTALRMHTLLKFPDRVKEIGYNCRFCEFARLCEAELSGLDTDFIRKADFRRKERTR